METELILFTRTPEPGRAKTRLIPRLGETGAAAFAAALIEASVSRAVRYWPGPVRLEVWPDTRHQSLESISTAYDIPVTRQSDGDLGMKMLTALGRANERGRSAAIMGCDVPHCPAETYRTAYAFLSRGRSVIGPSRDGGYYLVGINPPRPACFEGIEWGSGKVLDTTLERAAAERIDLIVLQQLDDIDRPEDLDALEDSHPDLFERLMARRDNRQG